MNGTTLSCVMRTPLTSPHSAAAAIAGRAPPPAGRMPGAQRERDRDRGQRDDRADGQIDAAGGDHDRHAERRDADDRGLARHQLEVGRREELAADEQAEDGRDDDQPDEDAGAIDEGPRAS